MWCLRTCFSGGTGSVRLMVGHDDRVFSNLNDFSYCSLLSCWLSHANCPREHAWGSAGGPSDRQVQLHCSVLTTV